MEPALRSGGQNRLELPRSQGHPHSQPPPGDNGELGGYGALPYVHGYESMNRVGSVSVDGPYLESRFAFKSTRKIAKFAKFTLDLSATTHVFGLGYSFVEIREHSIGMECDCGCYRRLSTAH